jgi:hypothetical protein
MFILTVQTGTVISAMRSTINTAVQTAHAWHGSYVLESTIPPLFPLSIHENLEPGVLQRRSCYLPVEQFMGHAANFYFSVLQRSDF